MKTTLEKKIASITQVLIYAWGNTIEIEGIDDPFDKNKYSVVYKNCKNIKWEILEQDPQELTSDCVTLLGWQIGEDNYKIPAIITTSFFELEIFYENYEVDHFPTRRRARSVR